MFPTELNTSRTCPTKSTRSESMSSCTKPDCYFLQTLMVLGTYLQTGRGGHRHRAATPSSHAPGSHPILHVSLSLRRDVLEDLTCIHDTRRNAVECSWSQTATPSSRGSSKAADVAEVGETEVGLQRTVSDRSLPQRRQVLESFFVVSSSPVVQSSVLHQCDI